MSKAKLTVRIGTAMMKQLRGQDDGRDAERACPEKAWSLRRRGV